MKKKTTISIISAASVTALTAGTLVATNVINLNPDKDTKTKKVSKNTKNVKTPAQLALTDKQQKELAKFLAKKNSEQVTSVVNLKSSLSDKNSPSYYVTEDGQKIYVKGDNNGKGLQVDTIIAQYNWDNNDMSGGPYPKDGEDYGVTGYKDPQDIEVFPQGQQGHLAITMKKGVTFYIFANDGNIYEVKTEPNQISDAWRPSIDDPSITPDRGFRVKPTTNKDLIKELEKVVGYKPGEIDSSKFDNAEALSEYEKYALVMMHSKPYAMGGIDYDRIADPNSEVTGISIGDDHLSEGNDGRQIIGTNRGAAGGGGFAYEAVKIDGDKATVYNTPKILNPDDFMYMWRTGDGGVKETFSLSEAYNSLIKNNPENRKTLANIVAKFYGDMSF